MKVKKAIIPAAGMGTRVLPASKAVPKEMLNIVDKPAIQYIVEEAFASGIEDVLIITNRGKGAIEDHFDHAFELEAYNAIKGSKKQLQKVNKELNRIYDDPKMSADDKTKAVINLERKITEIARTANKKTAEIRNKFND